MNNETIERLTAIMMANFPEVCQGNAWQNDRVNELCRLYIADGMVLVEMDRCFNNTSKIIKDADGGFMYEDPEGSNAYSESLCKDSDSNWYTVDSDGETVTPIID